MTSSERIDVLVGVTAAGKTALSLALAEELEAEILSMDSMLVYRGLDVGTAKPSPAERDAVPHHLIDLVGPEERYDVQRYLADFRTAEAAVRARGRRPLVVGGTGFYLKAILSGLFDGPPADLALRARIEERAQRIGAQALHDELRAVDPVAAQRIHPNDAKRVRRALEVFEQTGRPLSAHQAEWGWGEARASTRPARLVGVACDEPALTRRVAARTRAMLDGGWVEEARRVRETTGFGPTAAKALGYAEVLELADGRATRAETEERITLRTRQFARRQRTWFRKFAEILWIDPESANASGVVKDAFGREA